MHDCWRPASEPSREVCSDFRSVSLLLDLQRRYKSFGLKDLSRFLWRNYRLIVFYPIFFDFDWDITSCKSEVYIYIYIYMKYYCICNICITHDVWYGGMFARKYIPCDIPLFNFPPNSSLWHNESSFGVIFWFFSII